MSVRRVLAINAGRRNNNTAAFLKKALEGAKSEGAQTEIIHLHDYTFAGCRGCYACKKLKNVPPKTCFQKDELSPILEKCVYQADSVIVGSPIYFWEPCGFFRCFSERLLYPYYIYGAPKGKSYYPRKDQKWGLIFTMGANKKIVDSLTCNNRGKDSTDHIGMFYKKVIGKIDEMEVYMTYHVKKFEGYELDTLREPERKLHHDQTWEKDLQSAYLMGKRLAKQ